MTDSNTAQLSAAGVSIWLDDLSRERINSGGLQKLIAERNVVGVTTNPTIFASALAKGEAYDDQVALLAKTGVSVTDAVFEITTDDVTRASDIFREIYDTTNGFDGRVSIEVEPGLAHDAKGTVDQAIKLAAKVGRPNALIKIPATVEGLEAITAVIAQGISVNVTLIFSLERYRAVINAYLTGLEQAKAAGIDISEIHSVASFFVSRVDTEIDKRLDAVGTDEATALKGKAGVANAQLAYEVYTQAFATERAAGLLAAGANKQRPLWASTGVKDPAVLDTTYVVELVAQDVVNTMPEKTLEATFDHGEIRGDTISSSYASANEVMDAIAAQGVSYDEVTELLEKEGVEKFIVSWNELLDTVSAALEAAVPTAGSAE
ncbi:transaldolase [Frigoribacterium sp. PvP120]|jgi:transaldolase|uniref:transaldolase n=1 Tax=Frigoribacterium TaxID=96492 RepID=UPI001421C295|nr:MULTISPECIES: transaldolase [Frigoribacterium]MBD8659570.1 transaldolase [Frigoribacterium sp. CFBP 8754]MBD8727943.1 transaldolase [Frigoribacterium sp. CFBP 13707]MBP1241905.1 transaldolase [Frigoribacterium sp. PvP121]NII50764.1 transaldolase [Frigoribacterium endophyticum]QNE42756.1 transaldolase [Frigoribacterium sp. NBH87]